MRHWTEEDRRRQAERIHQWQPWKTKGVKSAACKKASSRNAFKHGRYSASTKAIYSYLAASRMLIRALEQHRKLIKGAAKANRMCRDIVAATTVQAASEARALDSFTFCQRFESLPPLRGKAGMGGMRALKFFQNEEQPILNRWKRRFYPQSTGLPLPLKTRRHTRGHDPGWKRSMHRSRASPADSSGRGISKHQVS